MATNITLLLTEKESDTNDDFKLETSLNNQFVLSTSNLIFMQFQFPLLESADLDSLEKILMNVDKYHQFV